MKKCLIFLIFLFATEGFSQGFKNPPESASSLSQAGAFVAQCDDASAVTINPAGLIQIDKGEILFGFTSVYSKTKYSTNTFQSEKKYVPSFLPYFFYVPDTGNKNFKFGIGITSPYGQATKWPEQTVNHWNSLVPPLPEYQVPYFSGMQTLNFTPAFSWKLNSNFSFGLGLNFYYSRVVNKSLLPGNIQSKVNIDGNGYGITVGFLYKEKKWRYGLTYKSGFKIDYDGKFKVPSAGIQSKAEAKIKFPHTVQAGIAFYPNKKLKIEFDTEYMNFSTLKTIPVNINSFISYSIPKYWKEIYNFYLGAEYKKSEKIKFRGGIARLKSPVPDTTWEPSLPDSDTFIFSFGTEVKTTIGNIEITFLTSFPEKKTKGGNYEGIYKSRGYFLTLGYKREI